MTRTVMAILAIFMTIASSCNGAMIEEIGKIRQSMTECERGLRAMQRNESDYNEPILNELQSQVDRFMLDLDDLNSVLTLLSLVTDADKECAGRAIARNHVGTTYAKLYMNVDSLQTMRNLPWDRGVVELMDCCIATFNEEITWLKLLLVPLGDCDMSFQWAD